MKSLLLVGMAREKSTRCQDKMIKSFGDTTLFDLYLTKLHQVMDKAPELFKQSIIAINKNDEILWNKANDLKLVPVKERPDSSIAPDSILSSNFSFLKDYDEDYVIWVNGSFPFLKPDTIISAVALFAYNSSIKSLHCVKKRKNWFWNEKNQPITIRDKRLSRTQDSISIYESVHCFHIFNREYLLNNCAYWDFTHNNPYLYEVDDSIEFLDIDTELEFNICKTVYRAKKEVK